MSRLRPDRAWYQTIRPITTMLATARTGAELPNNPNSAPSFFEWMNRSRSPTTVTDEPGTIDEKTQALVSWSRTMTAVAIPRKSHQAGRPAVAEAAGPEADASGAETGAVGAGTGRPISGVVGAPGA